MAGVVDSSGDSSGDIVVDSALGSSIDSSILRSVIKVTGAASIDDIQEVQSLWSGYGFIKRFTLSGASRDSVIVKQVILPDFKNSATEHPRGWNTDLSHQRKLHSYKVECNWYQHFSNQSDLHCRVALTLHVEQDKESFLIIMEDLDDAGYPLRKSDASYDEMLPCLKWLAFFHARYMWCEPTGLWRQGCYWHLETRPDELAALTDLDLKNAAHKIDQQLESCKFKTLVHGDAKLANFCFSPDGQDVAAVDFQYVGAGCGMKDLAYFIGSCLGEKDCERYEQSLLNKYFEYLAEAVSTYGLTLSIQELENEWRALFPWAWTDFHRFVKGWSPGHWKINDYSEKLARQVLASLS